MDWRSEEGKALLWKAYPEGYLAMRGVLTVGGWWCVHEIDGGDPDAGAGVFACSAGRFTPARLWPDGVKDAIRLPVSMCAATLTCGDLLPLLDPGDPATWACLKQALADAAGSDAVGLLWLKLEHGWSMATARTMVGEDCYRMHAVASFSNIDTEDPAEALVRALIQLRQIR